jgi:thiamine-phosphate pyrophosphorylase
VARAVERAGITMVILRELDLPDAEQVLLARELVSRLPVPVLVARKPELAAESGAAGVQLGWNSPSADEARAVLGEKHIIGASVHSVEEGVAAAKARVDYVTLGPIFPTPKPHGLVFPVGVEAIKALAQAIGIPIVAVGGITAENEDAILAAGASGVAAIRAFMAAGA